MIGYIVLYVLGLATLPVLSKIRKRRKRKKLLATTPAEATEKFERAPKPGPVKRKDL